MMPPVLRRFKRSQSGAVLIDSAFALWYAALFIYFFYEMAITLGGIADLHQGMDRFVTALAKRQHITSGASWTTGTARSTLCSLFILNQYVGPASAANNQCRNKTWTIEYRSYPTIQTFISNTPSLKVTDSFGSSDTTAFDVNAAYIEVTLYANLAQSGLTKSLVPDQVINGQRVPFQVQTIKRLAVLP
jgi:hypothetical protein